MGKALSWGTGHTPSKAMWKTLGMGAGHTPLQKDGEIIRDGYWPYHPPKTREIYFYTCLTYWKHLRGVLAIPPPKTWEFIFTHVWHIESIWEGYLPYPLQKHGKYIESIWEGYWPYPPPSWPEIRYTALVESDVPPHPLPPGFPITLLHYSCF